MADIYSSNEGLLRDYAKLNQEYKNKAGRFIKNLLRLQRAENGIEDQLYQLIMPGKVHGMEKPAPGQKEIYRCSFCGKTQDEVVRLIAHFSFSANDHHVFICNECVELCTDVIKDAEIEEDNP